MYSFRLYDIVRKDFLELIYTFFLSSVLLTIGIMGICFFVRGGALAYPRSVILLSSLFYFIFLTAWYSAFWIILRKIHRIKNIVVIGNSSALLAEAIQAKYSRFYHVESQCMDDDPALDEKIKSADEVFICSDTTATARRRIMPLCIQYQKEVCYVPKYFDLSVMASSFDKTDDIPTFRISNMELSLEERFVKRTVDLLFGAIAFIVAFPLGLIVTLLVKLDGGPVFYAQERLTIKGKKFKILKFRTMIPDAEKLSGPVLAGDDDPRITKVGRFIRSVRLDELPQIINILKVDMSIVGPRPERPFFVEQFQKEIPEYFYRHKVKAGLTGLAQVEGKYNTSVENKLRYDLIYINNFSILKDILIMLQTVKILFMKESTEGVN
jgi:exopolysaccharide biosynthesis polyprenyl glycosylphosphotransferase